MPQYQWMLSEIAKVPRQKFFTFSPCDPKELDRLGTSFGPGPKGYYDFCIAHGGARLFRDTRNSWHRMEVFCPPEVIEAEAPQVESRTGGRGTVFFQVGYYVDSGYAGFEYANNSFRGNGALFASRDGDPPRRKVADSFEDWFRRTWERCRKSYTKEEWAAVLRPVPPFDARELSIVEALPRFAFKKAGVSAAGNVLIEVSNQSDVVLPQLTIGVRFESGGLEGRCALPTGAIRPGQACVIERPIYRGAADPAVLELFRLPPPEPEDRPYYWEFKEV